MRALFKSPLVATLALVLLGVLTQSLQLFDHIYWNVWYKNRAHPVETGAVVVSLDGGVPITAMSVAASTARQAQMLNRIVASGARQVYFDLPVAAGDDVAGDQALRGELTRNVAVVTLVQRSAVDPATNTAIPRASPFGVPQGSTTAISAWRVNFLGYAEKAEPLARVAGHDVPQLAIGGLGPDVIRYPLYPDTSIDPRAVPVVDARAILAGRAGERALSGKRVFVTLTNPGDETALGYFGAGEVPAAFVDIAGEAGLAAGRPIELGWAPFLLLFAGVCMAGARTRSRKGKLAYYLGFIAVAMSAPGLLREHNIVTSIGPTLAAILIYVPLRSSQKWRSRVQLTSSASGLPNVAAMVADGISRTQDVVAVSISQYEQMLANLPHELHGEFARQIARRLSLGAGDRRVFDNDSGHFVWLEDSRPLDALIGHLDGLRALFSSPVVIGAHVLDTTVHFGIDRNFSSKPLSRIRSALASANEAQAKGKLYEEFGEQRLAESPWELSLHARIDEGLRSGAIWLALQPQFDLRNQRFSGAEALIRWNDPERGEIPPDAFILQAERAGRIEAITYWVLEQAIGMLGELNRIAAPFQISVNLSARMVDHPALVHRIADIVRETRLRDCSLITFEVTETFSLTNRDQARVNLAALRAMGFRLSIDDFGTGQASLAYLAEIPSDEIKLDRCFVQPITTSRREQLIVSSVITLAHALGQEVVAEGIEDAATLDALEAMGCDLAQGFYLARPMRLSQLVDVIQKHGEPRLKQV